MSKASGGAQRLVSIVTALMALLVSGAISLAYQPRIDELQERLDDTQAELRSDDIAFSEMPRLRLERAALAARYDDLLAHSTEATFLRELAASARRHDVVLVSTAVTQDTTTEPAAAQRALFQAIRVSLELRGRYARLLAAVRDLSHGVEIVGVDTPALRRDGEFVVATVPVTLYEPVGTDTP